MKKISILLLCITAYCTSYSQNFGIGTVTPTSTLTVTGSLSLQYTTVTTKTYALTSTDYFVSWSNAAAGTITLPTAVSGAGNFKGRMYVIRNIHVSKSVDLAPAASETINGAATFTLNAGEGVTLISTGLTTGITWEVLAFSNAVSSVSNDWSINGNAGISSGTQFLGTTDANDLIFRTNNIERMYLNTNGDVAIGSTNFDAVDPEKLMVDVGSKPSSHTILGLKGDSNDYLQLNIQNTSNGNSATTDIVATADNGTADSMYIDMGINGSKYAPGIDNFGGVNDGYLYVNARNLLLGTQNKNDIIFLTGGGSYKSNEAMRIDGQTRNLILGKLENSAGGAPIGNTMRGPNAGTNSPPNSDGGSLTILGGTAIGKGTGGSINITGGTAVFGAYGAVNINAGTNNATNINTGTSNQNITIGGASNSLLLPKFSTAGTVLYSSSVAGLVAATAQGTTGQFLMSNAAGAPTWNSGTGNFWALKGNGATNSGTNYLGTNDSVSLRMRTNNIERMVVDSLGRVGIGLTNPTVTLQVKGTTGIGVASNTTGLLSFYNSTNANAATINAGITTSAYTLTLPLAAPASNGQVLTGTTAGVLSWTSIGPAGSGWGLTGNGGTTAGTNFVGTTDGQGLVFKVSNTTAGYLGLSGSSYATSFGVGASGTSTAFASTAIGAGAQATGSNASLAVGYNAKATTQDAIAIGDNAQGKGGNEAIAIGLNSIAGFSQSIAIGSGALASSSTANNETIAIGHNANANSYQGIAIGTSAATTTNNDALAIGVNAAASGSLSTAIGYNAKATANNTVIIGDATNGSLYTGIGTSTPTAKLDVAGTFKLGSAGTILNGMIRTTIVVSDATTFLYTSTRQIIGAIPGVNTNATIILNPRSALPAGIGIGWVFANAANTITIGFTNTDATARAVGNVTFDVTVIQ